MAPDGALSGKTILRFYYPLALSWFFMGLDGPISVAVMSGLPDPRVNTAAFLILLGLAIWIESPVIDLLSTATTLGKTARSVGMLNRFSIYLIAFVTAAHGIVTFTPLFWVLTEQVLGVPHDVAAAVRPGLILMLPWSGFIGWRRSRQGLLIRNGHTRIIGLGTLLRVTVLVVVDLALPHFASLPGLTLAAWGLITSVAAEAIFIYIVSRDVIRGIDEPGAEIGEPMTMKRMFAFHWPLTATSMLKLLTGPIVAAGLARLVDPTRSLAAYEVAWTVLFLFRVTAFCLPEVVIALYRDEASRLALRRFALGVGIGSSGILLLLTLLRLDGWVFQRLMGVTPDLAERAHWMFMAAALTPFLDAMMSYVLGILTSHHLTVARMVAVFASSLALVGGVAIAVIGRWSPPALVGISIAASLGVELGVLALAWVRAQPKLSTSSAAAR
ncbi:hypothetical protein [Fimbriimonas ginsengisoli]|uniref:Polysaccharide biosynthesis protein n=1 Tax=Fimbriimonas ginsengisoli Gsoil 348 TaxID=661478 RepID=A0A068NUJ3_FIMGI|nr:hypothetical protein [Fimbriimonas ginsengisoli]AIE87203.1 hypothetical protein OP10G_3835 [Fimbriimonas ginsengisoli Gsoil 348]